MNLLVAEGHVSYVYNDLLDRIGKMLKDKNPQVMESNKLTSTEDVQVVKLGTTKVSW